ncbi:MAG TPA: secretin N-terminal domain-containing protein [Rhodocyclaceae bacterium]|mgnify:CR=1 FL=1|nr:secretin N-terminal domain-containing protein [Rhodocyclaceae bacterium]
MFIAIVRSISLIAIAGQVLSGCAALPVEQPVAGHLLSEDGQLQIIPQPVRQLVVLPRPQPAAKGETYSVVVNNVKAEELLFSLARDARMNIDIHPGITGGVTLTAINQTLPQLLNRISRQIDMRWEFDGKNLVVMPDSPFLRVYKVDYVNMSRDTGGNTTVTTQIASTAPGAGGNATSGGNNSQTRIENIAKNHFWETLEKNLKDILRETDKILPEGSSETFVEHLDQQSTTGTGAQMQKAKGKNGGGVSTFAASPNPAMLQQEGTTLMRRTTFREAASVIANPESGILSIRATSRQHEKIQEFLDQVMSSANRQVMIEATIAEVQLSSNYQQGIDWSILPLGNSGFKLIQRATGSLAGPSSSIFELGNSNHVQNVGMVSSSIRLLENFGTVKVLSSPTLSVINNQTAVLKVVDNYVYFTIKAETVSPTNAAPVTTFTTNLSSVPVGFVMNVTPQISSNGNVLLNIRPSISRVVDTVNDPNPDLAKANVTSRIPVIRIREMESMIRIASGNIAVMGGLMEDTISDADAAVPGLSRTPLLGNFFVNRDDRHLKTELVVFLRPVVIGNASIDGDYRQYRGRLPDRNFFRERSGSSQTEWKLGRESGREGH